MAKRSPGCRAPLRCTARTSESLTMRMTLAPKLGETSRNKISERFPGLTPLYLCQRRFGFREPEGHVHGLVQIDSRGELGTGLLALAGHGRQDAEAPVAVGLERAQAECLGQGQGLL